MPSDDLTALSAAELSAALHRRDVSCREVMAAYLARIDAINPRVNAVVGLLPPAAGLPMGMQLIGPPLGDLAVIEAAAAYEQTLGELLARRPALG